MVELANAVLHSVTSRYAHYLSIGKPESYSVFKPRSKLSDSLEVLISGHSVEIKVVGASVEVERIRMNNSIQVGLGLYGLQLANSICRIHQSRLYLS
jgi:hypothetical protein